ncbi:hypothetical protein [Staphylococcus haemolyticus]|uniref:hypothetical protein n=1 Tax=Staphylococcus haemolyticus TaxID=1283 RepID=UPI001F0ACB44|nr:hypothetical protein [Staphylococcus haemolyticus]MCH4365408.1 hypothetical protein [Staphylococcus haemolyticus]MCH4367719.1 hypothetical protein [Staphylococcus haemolyticus]
MKQNKWIMWVIFASCLLGLNAKGVSIIGLVLSLVVISKYQLVDRKAKISKSGVAKFEEPPKRESIKVEREKRKEEKEEQKAIIQEQQEQEAIENSYNYFGVDFIDANVSKTREAPFYNKIKTDTEKVIDAVKASSTKKVKKYKRHGYRLETKEKGILVLTTENVYFLTASHGFAKTVYPIKNVNGMKTEMAYLYITYGRTDHIYSVLGWKRSSLFMQNYINNFYG